VPQFGREIALLFDFVGSQFLTLVFGLDSITLPDQEEVANLIFLRP
jgi:hypothetical protein